MTELEIPKTHPCTSCNSPAAPQAAECKGKDGVAFRLWRVVCTNDFFSCGAIGPFSNIMEEAVEKWHILIGRYVDGGTRHM